MIAFLSPAKNMQPGRLPTGKPGKIPYPEETGRLADALKKLQPWEFEHILKIGPELGWEAFARYQDLDLTAEGVPAVLAYKGLAFLHLNPWDFTPEDFRFAGEHLKIMSALYGMLSATDGIEPYRLELRCRFRMDGKNLYRFWGDRLYRDLFAKGEPVINLASKEYSNLITPFVRPQDRFITCDFLTPVRGKLRTLPALAKMGRGEMARYIIKNRLEDPENLKGFVRNGYRYSAELSTGRRFVFVQWEE